MRGQAAMEFLMTYGWAILMVISAIGALTYWGVLKPESVIPDQCILSTGFVCSSYKVMDDAGQTRVYFTLENKFGKGIIIQRVNMSSKAGATDCNIPAGLSVGVDEFERFDCTIPTSTSLGESTTTGITVTYLLFDGSFNKTLTGTIKAKTEGCPTGGCPAAGLTCPLVAGQFCHAGTPANSQAATGSCGTGTTCRKCSATYTWDGAACTINPTCLNTAGQFCVGSQPANSYVGIGVCGATGCYACNSGYNWDGVSCVASATFDYSLSSSGGITVPAGFTAYTDINSLLLTGTASPVTYSPSALPSGATAVFTPASCAPPCTSRLNITTTPATPAGISTITVTGVNPTRTTPVILTVTGAPLAYWKFDEGSGTTAIDSSGTNNGVLANGAGYAAGHKGTAVNLDGFNDAVTIPNSASLQVTAFTSAFWVYPRLIKPDWQPLVTKQANDGYQRTFGTFLNPGSLVVHYSFQAADCATWRSYNGGSLTLNTWNHVVHTYDGTTSTLYLNGAYSASTVVPSTVCQTTNGVSIGNSTAVYLPFDGMIDDVAIYNRAISPTEVLALYRS